MKTTLKEFIQLFEGTLLGDAHELLGNIHKELRDRENAPLKLDTRDFIEAYCHSYRERWGTNPVITGKITGIAKRLVKDLGKMKSIMLVKTYLTMDDYTFTVRRHDLVTFEQNLNAVKVMLETGQTVTQNQAKRKEAGNANTTAMRKYLEKRRNDG